LVKQLDLSSGEEMRPPGHSGKRKVGKIIKSKRITMGPTPYSQVCFPSTGGRDSEQTPNEIRGKNWGRELLINLECYVLMRKKIPKGEKANRSPEGKKKAK